jgi:hypothetical protein
MLIIGKISDDFRSEDSIITWFAADSIWLAPMLIDSFLLGDSTFSQVNTSLLLNDSL